jgi:ADP-ribosylglycohydrolase
MAIPFLIGGAVVAAAAAAVAFSSDDSSSSSSSSSGSVRDEEKRLEKARASKERSEKKKELEVYSRRVVDNLAKKYGDKNLDALARRFEDGLGAACLDQEFNGSVAGMGTVFGSVVGAAAIARNAKSRSIKQAEIDLSLIEETKQFLVYKEEIRTLEAELKEMDVALSTLEALDDEFK